MLRGSDVPRTMRLVEAALAKRAARPPERRPAVTYVVGDQEVDPRMARLRSMADIRIEFHSGSARPVVGPAVRLAKRGVRRALRWYVQPIMEQQTRFNHAVLDLVDRLRLEMDQGPSGPLSGDQGPSGPLSGDQGPDGERSDKDPE